jgi:hypothetical protein
MIAVLYYHQLHSQNRFLILIDPLRSRSFFQKKAICGSLFSHLAAAAAAAAAAFFFFFFFFFFNDKLLHVTQLSLLARLMPDQTS